MKISKQARKLAQDLNLSDADAYIMELKANLYSRCSSLIQKSDLSHEEISKQIGTSRSRITRISNLGENNISIEILIKIIAVLEGMPEIKFAA